jgi:peroxiredoxin
MNPQLLAPGEIAPDFELEDINGNSIRLSSFRGRKPVVLAFLRGFM